MAIYHEQRQVRVAGLSSRYQGQWRTVTNYGERWLPPFHGENTGSIPVGRAKHINDLVKEVWDRHDRGPNCEGRR
jgi:hypothetical protein